MSQWEHITSEHDAPDYSALPAHLFYVYPLRFDIGSVWSKEKLQTDSVLTDLCVKKAATAPFGDSRAPFGDRRPASEIAEAYVSGEIRRSRNMGEYSK